jgi:adenylate kinase family enzyme
MFIMRGLPGSGKSTVSKKIAQTYTSVENSVPVCAGDDFFIQKDTGEYKFDANLLSEAHASAKNKATEACK